jgi:glc operon protein GlcG
MRTLVLTSLTACGSALISAPLQRRHRSANRTSSAAGGTADGTPFDVPYGTPISLETAKKLVAAVEARGRQASLEVEHCRVDTHGDLVHFSRMDGAQLASINVSQGQGAHCRALSS